MASYATLTQARIQGGRDAALTPDQTSLLTQTLDAASRLIDEYCGQWFDSRTRTLRTQAGSAATSSLILPVPLVSLTSVTEDGVTLTLADLADYPGMLVKKNGDYWTQEIQGVVIIGSFGFSAVPASIVHACADLALILAGMKTRAYVDGSGIAQSVTVNSLPDIIRAELDPFKRKTLGIQPYKLSAS